MPDRKENIESLSVVRMSILYRYFLNRQLENTAHMFLEDFLNCNFL